jgi:hypothetical protein
MSSSQIYESCILKLTEPEVQKKINFQLNYYPVSEKTAVIVDPRYTPLMEAVIINFMYYMNKEGWNLLIISAKEHKEKIKLKFPNAKFQEIPEKYIHYNPNPNLTITSYNKLFMSREFWINLPTKYIAIFQTDCIMYKMFEPYYEKIYAYSGANYYNPAHISFYYGGINGGFSIRNKEVMLECIEKITWEKINEYRVVKAQEILELNKTRETIEMQLHTILNSINEDIYFTHGCEMLLKPVPDYYHRSFLAIETDKNYEACVYHGWNKNYHTTEEAYKMLKKSSLFKELVKE